MPSIERKSPPLGFQLSLSPSTPLTSPLESLIQQIADRSLYVGEQNTLDPLALSIVNPNMDFTSDLNNLAETFPDYPNEDIQSYIQIVQGLDISLEEIAQKRVSWGFQEINVSPPAIAPEPSVVHTESDAEKQFITFDEALKEVASADPNHSNELIQSYLKSVWQENWTLEEIAQKRVSWGFHKEDTIVAKEGFVEVAAVIEKEVTASTEAAAVEATEIPEEGESNPKPASVGKAAVAVSKHSRKAPFDYIKGLKSMAFDTPDLSNEDIQFYLKKVWNKHFSLEEIRQSRASWNFKDPSLKKRLNLPRSCVSSASRCLHAHFSKVEKMSIAKIEKDLKALAKTNPRIKTSALQDYISRELGVHLEPHRLSFLKAGWGFKPRRWRKTKAVSALGQMSTEDRKIFQAWLKVKGLSSDQSIRHHLKEKYGVILSEYLVRKNKESWLKKDFVDPKPSTIDRLPEKSQKIRRTDGLKGLSKAEKKTFLQWMKAHKNDKPTSVIRHVMKEYSVTWDYYRVNAYRDLWLKMDFQEAEPADPKSKSSQTKEVASQSNQSASSNSSEGSRVVAQTTSDKDSERGYVSDLKELARNFPYLSNGDIKSYLDNRGIFMTLRDVIDRRASWGFVSIILSNGEGYVSDLKKIAERWPDFSNRDIQLYLEKKGVLMTLGEVFQRRFSWGFSTPTAYHRLGLPKEMPCVFGPQVKEEVRSYVMALLSGELR